MRVLSVNRKVMLFSVVVLPALLCGLALAAGALSGAALERAATSDLEARASLVEEMAAVYSRSLERSAADLHQVFSSYFPEPIVRSPGRTVRVAAVEAPELTTGGRVLNLETAEVDHFRRVTGSVATIFARTGDDFVRITTSLLKEDGTRAVGTRLGQQHPAWSRLLAGRDYTGKAVLFGKDYVTRYVPILEAGEVIGALFIGVDFTQGLAALRERLHQLEPGHGGYFFVVDSRAGEHFGKLIVHPSREGEILGANGGPDRALLEALVAVPRATQRLVFADAPGASPRDKVASWVAFPGWSWIVCGVVDREQILADGRRLAWQLCGGAAVVVAMIAFAVRGIATRLVVRPLEESVAFARAVAGGDLSVETAVHRADEFGLLAEAHNEMVRSLRSVVETIRTSSESLALASDGMRASTEQAAQGATEQAASAEEASGNIEQTSAAVQQNAANAAETEAIARSAASGAAEGYEAMSGTIAAMREIARKIGVIEEIAAQTNLLSLNAAIESARSGEHGRAFAVVAQEIRKLADRSRAAAVEIVELSTSSMSVAERAGGLLQRMVPDIQRTSELVREIAVASQQQAVSLRQVSDSIQQLDKVIQTNASSAEELSATASGVAGRAQELDQAVAFFRVDEAAAPRAPTLPAPTRVGRPTNPGGSAGPPLLRLVRVRPPPSPHADA